jgi:hypothetical protein
MKYPILLASLLALSLAACGKKEETAEAPAPAPEVVAPAEVAPAAPVEAAPAAPVDGAAAPAAPVEGAAPAAPAAGH